MSHHQPVIMKTTIVFKKHFKKRKIQQIDYKRLRNIANVQENYKSTILDRFNDINYEVINSQQKWNTFTDILKESAKTTARYIERNKRSQNANVIMLSDMKQNVHKQIELATIEQTKISTKDLWKPNHDGNPSGKETKRNF